MKTIIALAIIGMAGLAAAEDAKCAVNPGKAAKPGITAKHDGKTYSFCCNNCKKKFEADPAKYAK